MICSSRSQFILGERHHPFSTSTFTIPQLLRSKNHVYRLLPPPHPGSLSHQRAALIITEHPALNSPTRARSLLQLQSQSRHHSQKSPRLRGVHLGCIGRRGKSLRARIVFTLKSCSAQDTTADEVAVDQGSTLLLDPSDDPKMADQRNAGKTISMGWQCSAKYLVSELMRVERL